MMTSQGNELEGLLCMSNQKYITYCGAYIIINNFITIMTILVVTTAQFGQLNNMVRLSLRSSPGESLEGGSVGLHNTKFVINVEHVWFERQRSFAVIDMVLDPYMFT